MKLAAKKDERNPAKLWRQEAGNKVIGELRAVQRNRLRHDGYASDSAVLDDEVDDAWANSASKPVSDHLIIFPKNKKTKFHEIKLASLECLTTAHSHRSECFWQVHVEF